MVFMILSKANVYVGRTVYCMKSIDFLISLIVWPANINSLLCTVCGEQKRHTYSLKEYEELLRLGTLDVYLKGCGGTNTAPQFLAIPSNNNGKTIDIFENKPSGYYKIFCHVNTCKGCILIYK